MTGKGQVRRHTMRKPLSKIFCEGCRIWLYGDDGHYISYMAADEDTIARVSAKAKLCLSCRIRVISTVVRSADDGIERAFITNVESV